MQNPSKAIETNAIAAFIATACGACLLAVMPSGRVYSPRRARVTVYTPGDTVRVPYSPPRRYHGPATYAGLAEMQPEPEPARFIPFSGPRYYVNGRGIA